MEHAKKMMLVEPSVLERLNNINQNQPDVINHLDSEMKKILDVKNISDNEKWTLYNQALQKYLNFMKSTREPIKIPLIEYDQNKKAYQFGQNILAPLPKQLQPKAQALLNILSNKGITWNEMGNVAYDGNIIVGSNIIDLITDLMKSSKSTTEPVGWKNFADILYQINVPRALVVNTKRLKYINEKSTQRSETQRETIKEPPPSESPESSVAERVSRRRRHQSPFSWSRWNPISPFRRFKGCDTDSD